MSKNCENCRHFKILEKPWGDDQAGPNWECKLGKDEEMLDKMNVFIDGVSQIDDKGRNTPLQCQLIARKCDSYKGKSCSQCKHFHQEPTHDPENPAGYGPFDWGWTCKLDMVTEILEDPANPDYVFGMSFETEEQGQRYFAKRCEEYNDGDT